MQIQMTRLGAFALGLGLALAVTASAAAQTAEAPPRLVTVEGGAMRVWAAGLEQRGVGQPVVVLEAGAGAGLENWRPVFAEIAKRFPVLAYDRRGIGQSDADSEYDCSASVSAGRPLVGWPLCSGLHRAIPVRSIWTAISGRHGFRNHE